MSIEMIITIVILLIEVGFISYLLGDMSVRSQWIKSIEEDIKRLKDKK
jgi:hypothetical protein